MERDIDGIVSIYIILSHCICFCWLRPGLYINCMLTDAMLALIFLTPLQFSFKFQEQSQLASIDHMRGLSVSKLAAMEQTRMLAHTLAQNNDPKFQVIFDLEKFVYIVNASLFSNLFILLVYTQHC